MTIFEIITLVIASISAAAAVISAVSSFIVKKEFKQYRKIVCHNKQNIKNNSGFNIGINKGEINEGREQDKNKRK